MVEISPARLMRAMSEAQQRAEELRGTDEDLVAVIAAETDVFELMDILAQEAIADKLLAEVASERVARLKARADRRRSVVLRMLEALAITKLERPIYTASVSSRRKAPRIDPEQLDTEYLQWVRQPDMNAIVEALSAGKDVPGATLGNPEPHLTLRTK